MEHGKRTIDITLAFDPPINGNRADYIGIVMEYHLFRNSSASEVKKAYGVIPIDEQDDNAVPDVLKNKEIKMHPGTNMRKKSAHQKSTRSYIRTPKIIPDSPLILVVVCKKKWFDDDSFSQSYSIIATFKHAQEIDLYNMIRLKNQARVKVR